MKAGKSKTTNRGKNGVSIIGVTLLENHKQNAQETREKNKITDKIRIVLFSIGGRGV